MPLAPAAAKPPTPARAPPNAPPNAAPWPKPLKPEARISSAVHSGFLRTASLIACPAPYKPPSRAPAVASGAMVLAASAARPVPGISLVAARPAPMAISDALTVGAAAPASTFLAICLAPTLLASTVPLAAAPVPPDKSTESTPAPISAPV